MTAQNMKASPSIVVELTKANKAQNSNEKRSPKKSYALIVGNVRRTPSPNPGHVSTEEDSRISIQEKSSVSIAKDMPNTHDFSTHDNDNTQELLITEESLKPSRKTESTKRGLPAACLFVANLSAGKPDTKLQKAVKEHFTQWGRILNVKVLKDSKHRPYAFVQFEAISNAKKALAQAHGTKIDGRAVRVEQALVNRTLFIGRLNPNFTEEDIKHLAAQYGDTENIKLVRNRYNGRSKCCAFIKFSYRDDAVEAYVELRHTTPYIVEWATNIEQATPTDQDVDPQSIFVGLLNEVVVTKELLEERFKEYGEIVRIELVKRSGAYGGVPKPAFAFLKFQNEAEAQAAVAAENNASFLGRIIRVEPKQTQGFRQTQNDLLRQYTMLKNRPLPWPSYPIAAAPPAAFALPITDPTLCPNFVHQSCVVPESEESKETSLASIDQTNVEADGNTASEPTIQPALDLPMRSAFPHHLQPQFHNGTVQFYQPQMPFGPPQFGLPPPNEGFFDKERIYYAPPYIQTLEGPIYPYAPPMFLLPSGPPYPPFQQGNFVQENPAMLPPPQFVMPLPVHQHAAPLKHEQQDADQSIDYVQEDADPDQSLPISFIPVPTYTNELPNPALEKPAPDAEPVNDSNAEDRETSAYSSPTLVQYEECHENSQQEETNHQCPLEL